MLRRRAQPQFLGLQTQTIHSPRDAEESYEQLQWTYRPNQGYHQSDESDLRMSIPREKDLHLTASRGKKS